MGKETPIIVLDEIHKAKLWKRNLKGLFDTLENPTDILVTGSARLNVYKKGSDSLLGRYHDFRLHPFSLNEMSLNLVPTPDSFMAALLSRSMTAKKEWYDSFVSLMQFGGFPEPLFGQDEKRARLWRRGRTEKLIREDLRDLSRIPELSRVEMLASLLPEKVGSLFSIASLREDLEVTHETVKRWVTFLQELFYLYAIKPFQKSVASHLLKACHYWTDSGEGDFNLQYIRNKEKQEIDFLVVKDGKPWLAVEAKWSDTALSPNWKKFLPVLGNVVAVQVVAEPGKWNWIKVGEKDLLIASAQEFLAYLV